MTHEHDHDQDRLTDYARELYEPERGEQPAQDGALTGEQPGAQSAQPDEPTTQLEDRLAQASGARRRIVPLVAVVAAAVAVLVFAGMLASYVSDRNRETQIIADGFHISSDSLQVVASGAEPPTFTGVCGSDGTFPVHLYNYELENTDSISQVAIKYTVRITKGSLTEVKDGTTTFSPSETYTLQPGTDKHEMVLSVKPDGTDPVTVEVSTTAPYKKTLKATFNPSPAGITCDLVDYEGVKHLLVHTNQYEGTVKVNFNNLKPAPGVNEDVYGWKVGYETEDSHQAYREVQKEATYTFELLSASSASVSGGDTVNVN